MIANLKRFLETTLGAADRDGDGAGSREHRLGLAATALMLQIAAIDRNEDSRERDVIVDAASRLGGLTDREREELLALAREQVGDATSLYEFTAVINDLCDHEERQDIVEQLWRVALADTHVDHHEEHLIRRVSDLLHLTPSEFIRCRHRAKG